MKRRYLIGTRRMPFIKWLSLYFLAFGLLLVVVIFSIDSAGADGNPLNGTSPRPFYVFAHNPNTLLEVVWRCNLVQMRRSRT
jgi:hypothetical protein